MRSFTSIVILIFLNSGIHSYAQNNRNSFPSDLKIIDDIVYKKIDDTDLRMAAFLPGNTENHLHPCLIYFHGGGWANGDRYRAKRRDVIEVIRDLNNKGFVCFSVDYRLTDVDKKITVMESAADCKDAVRYIMKNSEKWNLDPSKISLFGTSAGAHLALVTALVPDSKFEIDPGLKNIKLKVNSAISYYGPTTFLNEDINKTGGLKNPRRMIPILGDILENEMETAKILSPTEWLRNEMPAVLLVQGINDSTVSYHHSKYMFEVASQNSYPVSMILVEGAGHGLRGDNINPDLETIKNETVKFILENNK